MKQFINKNICVGIFILFFLSSCKKNWLDQKPDSLTVILSTLADYQATLDVQTLHEYCNTGMFGELGGDNIFVPTINQVSYLAPFYIQSYIWAPDALQASYDNDWSLGYLNINICNVVLEGLSHIERTGANSAQWDQIQGQALFFRAHQYATLLQLYVKPYDSVSSAKDLGIPLRLTQDLKAQVGRGTSQQVYDQVIGDLQKAAQLLFTGPQPYQQLYRPTKAVAYAMLARVFLCMGKYQNALDNANLALQSQHTLLDYNTIPSSGNVQLTMPYWYKNPEVFFYTSLNNFIIYPGLVAAIDTNLYKSYAQNDLRKQLYFDTISYKPYVSFSGTYSGSSSSELFSAPAVDELYLIRAECKCRLNDMQAGMNDLNNLLVTRWKTGTFVPFTASTPDDALRIILTERRKELVMRGVRWSDLRRLNNDPRFQTTITRYTSDGVAHILLPHSNLYTWPIPPQEITITGIPQNPR